MSDYWCLQMQSFHVTSFFMFANTRLHVTSQCQDIRLTLIAIQCNSLCANCQFLKTGLVDHMGVPQTPTRTDLGTFTLIIGVCRTPMYFTQPVFRN